MLERLPEPVAVNMSPWEIPVEKLVRGTTVQLRGHGVDDVDAVAKAHLERDGVVTATPRRDHADTPHATAKDRVT